MSHQLEPDQMIKHRFRKVSSRTELSERQEQFLGKHCDRYYKREDGQLVVGEVKNI